MNNYFAFMQRICFQWCERTFGKTIARSRPERALRVAEEAIELCQISNVNTDLLHRLVDVVYSRPHGNVMQEVGGLMVTILVYCEQNHINLAAAMNAEIERVLNKDPDAFRIRMGEKTKAGVDASVSRTPEQLFALQVSKIEELEKGETHKKGVTHTGNSDE